MATVDARPDFVFPVKFPSGEVSVHEITPRESQKTVVREPSGTDSGTAQIAASGFTVGRVGADVEALTEDAAAVVG